MADYSHSSKTLHHLALGTNFIAEASFDVELATYRRKLADCTTAPHVFVAGLARAGTTVLMRALYQTGAFCSLTYRDMPFVLAPNLWANIADRSKKEMAAEQRAHQDGILVDFDSPEALEEVFWRVFCSDDYIRCDHLRAMAAADQVIQKFRDYVALIMKKYRAARYLSKNNNNLLRIETVRKAFPQAVILIPFRDPLAHAYSLLKQHQLFCAAHDADPFSRKYMTWLVHHEFGSDHRPFEWGVELSGHRDVNAIDYWLAQWVGVYSYLAEHVKETDRSQIFLGYELLCLETARVWQKLLQIVGVNTNYIPQYELRSASVPTASDPSLLKKALSLYDTLCSRSRSILIT